MELVFRRQLDSARQCPDCGAKDLLFLEVYAERNTVASIAESGRANVTCDSEICKGHALVAANVLRERSSPPIPTAEESVSKMV